MTPVKSLLPYEAKSASEGRPVLLTNPALAGGEGTIQGAPIQGRGTGALLEAGLPQGACLFHPWIPCARHRVSARDQRPWRGGLTRRTRARHTEDSRRPQKAEAEVSNSLHQDLANSLGVLLES